MKKTQLAFQFLRLLTFAKLWNAALVYVSYQLAKYSKRPIQWGLPISIAIEPTTACNLGCPECPSGLKQFSRPTGNLKQDFFRSIIPQLAGRSMYLTFYFQGEPYINPDFLNMVSFARQHGFYTSTSTNAHFLNEENAKQTIESGLHRIIISIDGVTQEVYEQYRINGQLDKVIEGTKNLVKWKKELQSATPHIVFQFLVVKPNEHQIAAVQQLANDLGVDELKLKTAQVYDYKNGNDLIPTINKYSRYKQFEDGTYKLKNSMDNHCWRLWSSCVVTWDGKVVPCCFDKDATHQLGNLRQDDFKQVWKNQAYQHFRAAVLKSRSEIDICSNCSEGTKVWA